MKNKLHFLNLSVFFQNQCFLLPVLFLFYQNYGLSAGDFFLFQGIFSLSAFLFEIPMGYLGDLFPKKNILILSYSFFILRLLLWIFFAQFGYWILMIGEILYAAQKTSFSGIADSYIYEYLKFNNIPQKMRQRYGKMNFFLSLGTALSAFISTGIYTAISEWSLKKYNLNYGFMALLFLELVFNIVGIVLLFKLPKIPQVPSRLTFTELVKQLIQNVNLTIKNINIRYHILYSGLMAAITVVFAWSFQPIMKLLLFPVSLYGVVYFINHLFRALATLYSEKISHFLSLNKLAKLVFFLFITCFILTFIILNIPVTPIWFILLYFTFISLTIGFQVAFRLLHDCRLHTFVFSNMRATASSVSTLAGRLYASFFFILMKILLDGISTRYSLFICFIVFMCVAISLKKVFLINEQEKQSV